MDYAIQTISQLRPYLISFRKLAKLRQQDVASRLGISQQAYAELEKAPETASLERLHRLFLVLGVSIVLQPDRSHMSQLGNDGVDYHASGDNW